MCSCLIHNKAEGSKGNKEWLVAQCSTGLLMPRRYLVKEAAKINLSKEDK